MSDPRLSEIGPRLVELEQKVAEVQQLTNSRRLLLERVEAPLEQR